MRTAAVHLKTTRARRVGRRSCRTTTTSADRSLISSRVLHARREYLIRRPLLGQPTAYLLYPTRDSFPKFASAPLINFLPRTTTSSHNSPLRAYRPAQSICYSVCTSGPVNSLRVAKCLIDRAPQPCLPGNHRVPIPHPTTISCKPALQASLAQRSGLPAVPDGRHQAHESAHPDVQQSRGQSEPYDSCSPIEHQDVTGTRGRPAKGSRGKPQRAFIVHIL